MMTEQEIIEFAKQNDYCWAGLQRRHPEVAEWMEGHADDCCIVLSNMEPSSSGVKFDSKNYIYRLRPDYEPEPEAGWRVYDVIANKGKYYVKDLGSCGGDVFLPNAIGRVGFGGVQFEGSPSEWWGMSINAYIDSEGMPYSQVFCDGVDVAVPVRARFWEDAQ